MLQVLTVSLCANELTRISAGTAFRYSFNSSRLCCRCSLSPFAQTNSLESLQVLPSDIPSIHHVFALLHSVLSCSTLRSITNSLESLQVLPSDIPSIHHVFAPDCFSRQVPPGDARTRAPRLARAVPRVRHCHHWAGCGVRGDVTRVLRRQQQRQVWIRPGHLEVRFVCLSRQHCLFTLYASVCSSSSFFKLAFFALFPFSSTLASHAHLNILWCLCRFRNVAQVWCDRVWASERACWVHRVQDPPDARALRAVFRATAASACCLARHCCVLACVYDTRAVERTVHRQRKVSSFNTASRPHHQHHLCRCSHHDHCHHHHHHIVPPPLLRPPPPYLATTTVITEISSTAAANVTVTRFDMQLIPLRATPRPPAHILMLTLCTAPHLRAHMLMLTPRTPPHPRAHMLMLTPRTPPRPPVCAHPATCKLK
jgi:hypothetical protein